MESAVHQNDISEKNSTEHEKLEGSPTIIQEFGLRATTNKKQEELKILDQQQQQQQQTTNFLFAVEAEAMTNPLTVAVATWGREDTNSVEEETQAELRE